MTSQVGDIPKFSGGRTFTDVRPLDQQLPSTIQASPDPVRAARFFREFRALHPEWLTAVARFPRGLEALATLSVLSRFLSDECLRHPEWLDCFDDLDRRIETEEHSRRLDSFLNPISLDAAHALALFRRKELLRIALRDGLELAPVAEITAELSSVADAILSRSLKIVTAEVENRHGTADTGFTVISLGKLGGMELNYSSDIDLMFLYGQNGQTRGPRPISNKEFFQKVANQLTGILSSYTGAGVCYRVDLRLRPEGSLGEVAVSVDGAKEYYARRARDWELQMLIKGRVSAGDVALGQELIAFVEPAIYSTTLDFSAIETMSNTRDRITEKLARRRLRESQLDVKLAPGGIRDIEFLVQCLQRLHGARDISLRHGGTLYALERLREKDVLSVSEHARLAGAYQFLRHLEHRLQLEDDRQTHVLPTDPLELERLATRMPGWSDSARRLRSPAQLLQTLNQHLESVQVLYDRIVHAQRPLGYSIAGFAPPLLQQERDRPENAIEQGIEATSGSDKLSCFSEKLKDDPYYLHLLNSHETTASYTRQILELSPYLTEQLGSSPGLLDEIRYVAEHPAARPAFEALAGPLNDVEGLRRFFRRQMFRILTGSICLPEPVFATLDRTSGLAEYMIARAYRVALEQELTVARQEAGFAEPVEQMTVVALGRLGMREFDLGSDADLVFVVPDREAARLEFWTRVAGQMIDILSQYQGDGSILNLDTRLRPNGREGPLVQTESSFTKYFTTKAEAWEGIAYMKARSVAGDLDRATRFLTELQQVDWRRYGQGGRSRHDLRQMRLRLQREHGASVPLKAGEGGYYDVDFILMYLRLKGAGLFFKSLNTPERIDIVEKMGHLERAEAEFLLETATFLRAVDHALRIVTGRAAARLPDAAGERDMVARLVSLWTGRRSTAESLEGEIGNLRQGTRRLFDAVFH